MGLTKASTGSKVSETELNIEKRSPSDRVIALAGNPNVGKSTVFNALTGMNQHTGNWPGKTVTNAWGYCRHNGNSFILVDIPGTYSLMAHSAEEEVARDFICFGNPDAVIVVCDATCLERNLNLVLQTLEITENVIVCVNLMDEAKKKNITIDMEGLSEKLGVPVVSTIARKPKSLDKLMQAVSDLSPGKIYRVTYPEPIEAALGMLEPEVKKVDTRLNVRWLCLKLLDYDEALTKTLNKYLGYDILSDEAIKSKIEQANAMLYESGITSEVLRDMIVTALVNAAERICAETVTFDKSRYNIRDRKIDRILTSRLTGFPVMALMLLVIFWITITGANYPSKLLSDALFWGQARLTELFTYLNAPDWLHGVLVLGAYRVVAWVVSVMLPPMAIFFPLFTLLEDLGYLPRVAFMLDKYFKKCCACGKQALTMCMGFGCNAAGVVGCRIIDSPRERLIATVTNNFVPCNGRFPTLIAIIVMFFVEFSSGLLESALSAIILTGVIIFSVIMTLAISKLLSKSVLKGVPSSFTLELPPYRRPQVGRIILRSIFDRTVFVLGRAVSAAAPAGVIIWGMANITIDGASLLTICSGFLDPFAKLLGLDGVILLAFILGFPANEIVMPIIIMSYMATGTIEDYESLASLKELLVNNGWTWVTAVSTMLFSLFHWPCSTTLLTIKKETQSLKWTAASFLIPTITGFLICFIFNTFVKLFT